MKTPIMKDKINKNCLFSHCFIKILSFKKQYLKSHSMLLRKFSLRDFSQYKKTEIFGHSYIKVYLCDNYSYIKVYRIDNYSYIKMSTI